MNTRYPDAFDSDTQDLLDLAMRGEIEQPRFRDDVVRTILESFGRGRSVLLVGPPGVGKTLVIHGLAHKMRESRHRGLNQLSTSAIMSGTQYIGDWQSKFDSLLQAASRKNAVLYFTDIWNLRTVGSSSNNPASAIDVLLPLVSSNSQLLIGEVSEAELAGLQKSPRFLSSFDQIRIKPLSDDQCCQIVSARFSHLDVSEAAEVTDTIMKLSRRFSPADAGPGSADNLATQVLHYQRQKSSIDEHASLDTAFVEKVFSIYSGLPLFVIATSETRPVRDIRNRFREQVAGQPAAIESVVEMIALYKSGLHDTRRPIGTFLFVGPTGVGKTELSKSLSRFLFGSETRMLRFDMSEFKDYHAYDLLLGSAKDLKIPARLLDPVMAQPFQVILFDEIEKAHPNIWDLLLQLLDEGRLSSPRGGTVSFTNTIVIATSNVGADSMGRVSPGFTDARPESQQADMRKALERVFRPELINRFQHVVPFYPLDPDAIRLILDRDINTLLQREGIRSRQLMVEVSEELIGHIMTQGYDARYGARALKRELQRQVILPLAGFLLEHAVNPGSLLQVRLTSAGTPMVCVVDDGQAIETPQPKAKVHLSGSALAEQIQQARNALRELSEAAGLEAINADIQSIETARNKPGFWDQRDRAYEQLNTLDQLNRKLTQFDRLNAAYDAFIERYEASSESEADSKLVSSLEQWQGRCDLAWLELVVMQGDDHHDAVIEVLPLSGRPDCRDFLHTLYWQWARYRHFESVRLCEPLSAQDPAVLMIKGRFAYGLLRSEGGIHRLRTGRTNASARVSVCPVSEGRGSYQISGQQALKKVGMYDGKIRSRLKLTHDDSGQTLMLQNEMTLGDNFELARTLGPCLHGPVSSLDGIVRRYDTEPFRIKDSLLDHQPHRFDGLKPASFDRLLKTRADAVYRSKPSD